MSDQERNALLAICFHAALADGGSSSAEQGRVRALAGGDNETELAELYQQVVTGRLTVASAAQRLLSPQSREQAFEMAAGVCTADEGLSAAERTFLEQLRAELGLPKDLAARVLDSAQAVTASAVPAGASSVPAAELDRMIHRAAVLNGALELLPNSLATMAIVPLQIRLVYKIGKSYGYELDRGHVKDFLATVGVGMGSQVLEKYATRLLGRVLGGGLLRGVAKQATSSAFSYASTYALGHAAKQYYAGGRKLSAIELRSTFTSLFEGAKAKHKDVAGEIESEAGRVKTRDLLPLVKDA
jgi:uncharacterized protein (DUF697 family)/uncharacterized tellurite resistance protein B-like protein